MRPGTLLRLAVAGTRTDTARIVLTAFGAVLGTLALLSAATVLAIPTPGRDRAEALTGGYHLAFAVGTALLVAALAVAYAVLRPSRAPEPGALRRKAVPTSESAAPVSSTRS